MSDGFVFVGLSAKALLFRRQLMISLWWGLWYEYLSSFYLFAFYLPFLVKENEKGKERSPKLRFIFTRLLFSVGTYTKNI